MGEVEAFVGAIGFDLLALRLVLVAERSHLGSEAFARRTMTVLGVRELLGQFAMASLPLLDVRDQGRGRVAMLLFEQRDTLLELAGAIGRADQVEAQTFDCRPLLLDDRILVVRDLVGEIEFLGQLVRTLTVTARGVLGRGHLRLEIAQARAVIRLEDAKSIGEGKAAQQPGHDETDRRGDREVQHLFEQDHLHD